MTSVEIFLFAVLVLLSGFLCVSRYRRYKWSLVTERQWIGTAFEVSQIEPGIKRLRADHARAVALHARSLQTGYRRHLLSSTRRSVGYLEFFRSRCAGQEIQESQNNPR